VCIYIYIYIYKYIYIYIYIYDIYFMYDDNKNQTIYYGNHLDSSSMYPRQ